MVDFKIENGWILSLLILSIAYGPKVFGGRRYKRLVNYNFASPKGRVFSALVSAALLIMAVYPLFLRLRVGTFMFNMGLALFIISGAVAVTSFCNYLTTPMDQAICRGIYRVSRNPIYLSMTSMSAAMAMMLHSLVIGGLVLGTALLQHFIILEEEQFCEQKYGEAFLSYKAQVPRYFSFKIKSR